MEDTVDKYRIEKRRLIKENDSLQEKLRLKEQEAIKAKSATELLHTAIAKFQQID